MIGVEQKVEQLPVMRRGDGKGLCYGPPKQVEDADGEAGPLGSFGCGKWVEKPTGYGQDHAPGCCWNIPVRTRSGSGAQGAA